MYFLFNIAVASLIISEKGINTVSILQYILTIIELLFVIINILAILQTRYVIFIFPFIISVYNIVYSVLLINIYNSNSILSYTEYQMSISIIILNVITFVYYILVGNPLIFIIEGDFIKRDNLKKIDDICIKKKINYEESDIYS